MAVGDVDVAFAFGGEELCQVAVQAVAQLHHLLGIDVERGPMHRLQDFVRHGGGSGNGQKLPAGAHAHGVESFTLRLAMDAVNGAEIQGLCHHDLSASVMLRRIWSFNSVAGGLGITSTGPVRF